MNDIQVPRTSFSCSNESSFLAQQLREALRDNGYILSIKDIERLLTDNDIYVVQNPSFPNNGSLFKNGDRVDIDVDLCDLVKILDMLDLFKVRDYIFEPTYRLFKHGLKIWYQLHERQTYYNEVLVPQSSGNGPAVKIDRSSSDLYSFLDSGLSMENGEDVLKFREDVE